MKPRYILKTFIIIGLIGCAETKLSTLQKVEITKVPLEVLLKNRARYHGSFVETEGFFCREFEWSAIHYPYKGDTIIRREVIKGSGRYDGMLALWDGLWIEEHRRFKIDNKLRGKVIKVRGYFDTTRRGHLGNFSATLSNTYFIQPVQSLLTTPASMQ